MRKTMVFYRGRAPSGTKTKWKMNEYRAFHHDGDGAGGAVTGPGFSHAAAPPNLPPQVIYSIELLNGCCFLNLAAAGGIGRLPTHQCHVDLRV
jgi:hypothetical protein